MLPEVLTHVKVACTVPVPKGCVGGGQFVGLPATQLPPEGRVKGTYTTALYVDHPLNTKGSFMVTDAGMLYVNICGLLSTQLIFESQKVIVPWGTIAFVLSSWQPRNIGPI